MCENALAEQTALHGCDEGANLVFRAQDSDNWKPVAVWLADHPECAAELAALIRSDRDLEREVRPRRSGLQPGSMLDEYELLEELGRGGMGAVYRARSLRVGQEVAIKVIRTDTRLSSEDLARFRFEAEVMAGLSHPNVVPMFKYGEVDGEPYFVMPLMPGGSLESHLKSLGAERQLAPKRAAEIVRDIALGVHHAHRHGLIHRDLKPANVLLDRDDNPRIADFGLARPVEGTVTSIAGSPAYMAPEQARGDKYLATSVDVHALGVILFELLTGRTPFAGGNAESVRRRVIDEPAPPVRVLRKDVPRDLETICARCLNKAPQERYYSAQALADVLTKYLNDEPIDDRRGWVWGTVSRALGWQRETSGMGSWQVAYWGAASTIVAMTIMQTAVLSDAPLWVSQAAIAYYLVAWLGLMWIFLVVPRDSRNPVERASTAIHLGAKFGCVAILPVQLSLHARNPLFALPSFLVVVGLAVFVHGVFYWGRLYLTGLFFFAVASAMPLIPARFWPTVYGLMLGAFQITVGIHLRHIHKSGEVAARSLTDLKPV